MPHEQVIAMLSLIGEEIGVSDSLSALECAGDAGQMSKPRDLLPPVFIAASKWPPRRWAQKPLDAMKAH